MQKILISAFLLVVGLVVLGKYARNDDVFDPKVEMAKIQAEENLNNPNIPQMPEGIEVPVPSDPQATYRMLRIKKMQNGNLEVLTRRDGPSGTSFARRELDCSLMQYRYLGEGDSREQAEVDAQDPGQLADILPPSISATITEAACARKTL